METILRPLSWSDFPAPAQELFRSYRAPGVGEAAVLEQNVFIEQALPRTVAGGLADEDLDAYRSPYPTTESRRPLLQWPRELPIDGEPADVVERVEAYDAWLAGSPEVPKLLLAFDPGPGTMVTEPVIEWGRENIAGLDVARCGHAGHQAPEDQPDAIATAIVAWAGRHGLAPEGATAGRCGPTMNLDRG